MTTVNNDTTTLTAIEARIEWLNLIEGCFQEEIYDRTERCMACNVKYYAHDYSDESCDEFETCESAYFDQDCVGDELVEQLTKLHAKTLSIPLMNLPERSPYFDRLLEIVEDFIDMWLDEDENSELDAVWKWLRGWHNANASSITPEHLANMAKSHDINVRIDTAKNKHCPAEILIALSQDAEWLVRGAVAYNVATPTDTLIVLATDPRVEVRAGVAHNVNTEPWLLLDMSIDDELPVLVNIAKNPMALQETLAQLATHDSTTIRTNVACNQNTSKDTLTLLANDDNVSVRMIAILCLDTYYPSITQ